MITSATTPANAAPPIAAERDALVGLLLPGAAALEKVAGVELARRAAIVLARAGCSTTLVVASPESVPFADDPRVGRIEIANDDRPLPDRVVLVAGDVVFPVSLVERLSAQAIGGRSSFAANDVGVVLVGTGAVVRSVLGAPGDPIASVMARARATADELRADGLLHDAATPRARSSATRAILRATGKAVDGPLTRLFERRISQAISSMLLSSPVTPNVMTSVSFAIGLSGAALLATTDHVARIIGAALFVFATIVDGCDGEIARSKFLESPFGKVYDTTVDIIVNAAVFLGIGVGTWRELDGVAEVRTAALLLVGGGVFAMAVVETVRRVIAPVVTPGSVMGRTQEWLERFATVEWCYLVLGLAILDQIPFFFFGAAVGANVFAVIYLVLGVLAWRRA